MKGAGGGWGGTAHLAKEIDAGEKGIAAGGGEGEMQAVALDLDAKEIDTAGGTGVDARLVVADDGIDGGHVGFEKGSDALADDGGPIGGGDAAGDLLEEEGAFGLGLAEVGAGDAEAA